MRRSVILLLLVTLSLSHYVNCADNNNTQNASQMTFAAFKTGWVAHDIRVKGPISLHWKSSNRDYQFYYMTYDSRKDYCEVTQVLTGSSNGNTSTCQYKFSPNDKNVQIRKLTLAAYEDDMAGISYSTAETRSRDKYGKITWMDFKKCGNSDATASSSSQTDEKKEEAETARQDAPVHAKGGSKNLISVAKSKIAGCQLNDNGTQITCTQHDMFGKVLLDKVKYDLPSGWRADWWAIHNANASALLVYFANCPGGYCQGYSVVRLTAKGVDAGPYVRQGMDLECTELFQLTVDFSDHSDGWTCMHAVCPESSYRKNSEVKFETILQYRQQCLKEDLIH